jgi:phosphate transport system protein
MRSLAENQVAEAVKAVLSDLFWKARKVKETENKIDKLDVENHDICQSVFCLQQPVPINLYHLRN